MTKQRLLLPSSSLSEHLSSSPDSPHPPNHKQGTHGFMLPSPQMHRLCCVQHPGPLPLSPCTGELPHSTTVYQNSFPSHEVPLSANCQSRKDPVTPSHQWRCQQPRMTEWDRSISREETDHREILGREAFRTSFNSFFAV